MSILMSMTVPIAAAATQYRMNAYSRIFFICFSVNEMTPWPFWGKPGGLAADTKEVLRYGLPLG